MNTKSTTETSPAISMKPLSLQPLHSRDIVFLKCTILETETTVSY